MRQFSSKATFLYKRVFPIAWFGIVGLVAVVIVPVILAGRAPLFMLLPLAMMSLIGYVIMRLLLFDLVDAAYLDDHYIIIRNIIRNKGVEERIAIQDVVNVNATVMTNPERITLTLRTPSQFGSEVTFMPPARLWPFGKHSVANELIALVQAHRDALLYKALKENRESFAKE